MAKTKTQPTLDAPLSVFDSLPDRSADDILRALVTRQNTLRSRLHDSQQRIDTIQQDLLRAQSAISAERIAEALLENPSVEMGELQTLHDELRMLDKTVDGLRRAILQGDQDILNREAELDAAACRTVKVLHRHNVRATINAMLHLHQSIRTQEDLRLELNRRGVQRTGHLPPFVHVNFLNGVEDIHSWLSGQLRELVYWQFLTESERLALQQGTLTELDLADQGEE
ncbi:MAG: hypothetical protein OJF51_002412 [Nitrospira sp.]|nr:MAG: hypothetical protein OJF51_002412 [Nitrospira sp.]